MKLDQEDNRPFPCSLLFGLNLFFIIFWNDIIQELEEVLEILKLPIFIFVEVLELLLVLLRQSSVKAREGVVGCGIAKRSALMTKSLEQVSQSISKLKVAIGSPSVDCA
jgi:hypothetical protein